jgi:tRNA uridine 5-carboxymethylaminomethyl modification enzyme
MFTSRAEYRVLLRQDNADERLTPLGKKLGLISDQDFENFTKKYTRVLQLVNSIRKQSIKPKDINPFLQSINSTPITQTKKLIDIALRPEVYLSKLLDIEPNILDSLEHNIVYDSVIVESAEIRIKYGGYIEREKQVADKLQRLDYVKINCDFDYDKLQSLSTEARQKLSKIKPETIGQASRIPGVSPSDINVLLVFLGR